MSKIISNSSPIVGLSILGKLSLLKELFDEVFIPEAVYQEIVFGNTNAEYGKKELQEAVGRGDFTLYRVQNAELVRKLYGKLHEGELEVIIGAKELGLRFVLMDEIAARKLATQFLLRPIGVVGVLVLAKESGKIAEVKPYLEQLMEHGFHISQKLFRQVLTRLSEI